MKATHRSRAGGGLAFLLVFLLLAAGIGIGGAVTYYNYARHFRAEAAANLTAIAALKAAELAQWREERLSDIAPYQNPLFAAAARSFLEKPKDPDARRALALWFQNYPGRGLYAGVFLSDTQGVTRFTFPETPEREGQTGTRVAEALRTGKATLNDLHRSEVDGGIHMSVSLPIFDNRDGHFPLGVLVFRINPYVYFYPLVQRWPLPSRSAETLLVRREGRECVFLNELRFQTNTALRLRLSLTNATLPAARVAQGEEGILEGVDYQGEPVLAAMQKIPNSPWGMVARMSLEEVYAPMWSQLRQITFLTAVLLLLVAGSVFAAWRQQVATHYKDRAQTAEALHNTSLCYQRLFETTSDGVLILNADTGVIEDVNPFLLNLLACPRDALLGRKFWDVGFFREIADDEDQFARLRQARYLPGRLLTLTTSAGGRRQIEFVSSAFFGSSVSQANQHQTIQCNIRDITGQKLAEIYHEIHRDVLQILNGPGSMRQTLQKILDVLQKRSGADAAGLRLQIGDDFPYFSHQGFSEQFLLSENSLLARDARGDICRNPDGSARLECVCGLVLSGKADPANPLFTPNGSCWSNDTLPLLDLPASQDPRLNPRNLCIHQGYASLAWIPIREQNQIVGLIHVASRQKGFFTLDGIQILENLAAHIGEALQRKQAEESLRKSEETFRALVQELPDIVIRFDDETRVLFVSDNISRVTRLTTPQFRGKCHRELGFPESQCLFWEREVRRVFQSGESFEIETLLDGHYRSTLYNIRFAAERNATGAIQSVLAVCRDITAHRQAERNYQMLFKEMHAGFSLQEIIFDANRNPIDWTFLEVNPEFEQITGLKAHEIIGQTIRACRPHVAPYLIEQYGKVALTGKAVRFEQYSPARQQYLDVSAFRPAPNQVAAVILDITARKRLEQGQEESNRKLQDSLRSLQELQEQMLQQARMSTLGQLASGIAHDFNNLLMPILGYSELLLADPAALANREKALDALRRINRAALDARQVTGRLRWIYKPADEAEYATVDLNAVAQEALEMTRVRWEKELGARNISIRAETRLAPHALALGDASQLREALMNLILNAVDAMPEGGMLTLSTVLQPPHTLLCVADTGIGMTEEVKARCQEAFFSSKGKSHGAGLGLTIVAGILSRHKGTLEIDSAPGRGTTVCMRLPSAPDSASLAKSPAHQSAANAPGTARLRILLAEDDPEVMELLLRVLQMDGHTVESARNGAEAIEKLAGGQRFDMVISDYAMPQANGDAVARAVQERMPATPVLLLSGFGELMNDETERPPGVTRILSKPISPLLLQQVVQEVAAKRG